LIRRRHCIVSIATWRSLDITRRNLAMRGFGLNTATARAFGPRRAGMVGGGGFLSYNPSTPTTQSVKEYPADYHDSVSEVLCTALLGP